MEKDSFLNSKILNINDKIENNFFSRKFNDSKIENDYQDFNITKNKNVKIFTHLIYSINFIYKIFSGKLNIFTSIFVFHIISSIIIVLLIILYYILKNNRHKIICQKINSILIIFFQGGNTLAIVFLLDSTYELNILRALFNMHFYTILEILLCFDSNFSSLVLFIFNFGIALIIFIKSYSETDKRFNDLIFSVLCIGLVHILKNFYSDILRENFIKKYIFKKYFDYYKDLINNINGKIVSVRKNEILFFNENFKTLLFKTNNPNLIKMDIEYQNISLNKINQPKKFEKYSNIEKDINYNNISFTDIKKKQNYCDDFILNKNEKFHLKKSSTILENENLETKKLKNKILRSNENKIENLFEGNKHTKVNNKYLEDFNEIELNKNKIKNSFDESCKYNPSQKCLLKDENVVKHDNLENFLMSSENTNYLIIKIIRSLKPKYIEKDFQNFYKGENLFEILQEIQFFKFNQSKNTEYNYHEEKSSNKFYLLGEFYCEYDKNFYQVYFRKLINYDDIIDFIFYDITKIKEAESIKAETKLKNLFFAKIAHEFKTPINSMLSMINNFKNIFSEVLKENGNNFVRKNLKLINQIEALSNYTIFLIKDIIDYSSNTSLKINLNLNYDLINIQDIFDFCKQIADTLLETKGKEKILKISENLKDYHNINSIFLNQNKVFQIFSDSIRIKQILINFLTNSIKFTKSGYIELIAKYELIEEKYKLILTIKDSGVGIKPENLKDLLKEKISLDFNKEYNQNGSGLGISICRYLAKQLNHNIKIESEYGKGSEFSIVIDTTIIVKENNCITSPMSKNKNSNNRDSLPIYDVNIKIKSNNSSKSTVIINDFSKMKIENSSRKLLKKSFMKFSNFKEDLINQKNNILENDKNINIISINNYYCKENLSKKSLTDSSTNSFNFNNSINIFPQNNNVNNAEIYCGIKDLINNNSNESIYNIRNSNQVNVNDLKYKQNCNVNKNYVCEGEEGKLNLINNKKKILLIDDHKFIRNALKNILNKFIKNKSLSEEFEIIEGSDGIDLLYQLIHDQSNNNLIKCIFTDENMEYINGSEAIEIVKKFEKNNKIKKIPIASITAFEDQYSINLIYNSGADIVLSKPCSEKDLMKFIDNYYILV